jgi:hypothetical protein
MKRKDVIIVVENSLSKLKQSSLNTEPMDLHVLILASGGGNQCFGSLLMEISSFQ